MNFEPELLDVNRGPLAASASGLLLTEHKGQLILNWWD